MKRDSSGLSRNFVDPAAGLFSKVRVILWGNLFLFLCNPELVYLVSVYLTVIVGLK